MFGATSVDEEIYFKAGGNNVVDDPLSGPVTEDSVFWICSQSKMITHVRSRLVSPGPNRYSYPPPIQIAALQLIERGKLSPEDLVVDYLPQMANPVIVEDEMAENLVYKPAQNVICVKHLLNFTNGTSLPLKGMTRDKLPDVYATLHPKEDPITGFFKVVKVCDSGTEIAVSW